MTVPSTPRLVYTSATNFLCVGDEYLMLHRKPTKKIDPNRLNGIGGKVDPGEDYLTAAIRETEEETGYKVEPKDVELVGIARLEGGYAEDWVVCFFKISVPSKKIPLGALTDDGELMWLHKDKVLDTGIEMVDDLKIVFPIIAEGKEMFFLNGRLNTQEKIEEHSLTTLPLSRGKI